jgi:hypothetical protein
MIYFLRSTSNPRNLVLMRIQSTTVMIFSSPLLVS